MQHCANMQTCTLWMLIILCQNFRDLAPVYVRRTAAVINFCNEVINKVFHIINEVSSFSCHPKMIVREKKIIKPGFIHL